VNESNKARRSTASNARYVFIFDKLEITFRYETGTPRIVSTSPLYHNGKNLRMYLQHERSGVVFALRAENKSAVDEELWVQLGSSEVTGKKIHGEAVEGVCVVVVPVAGREQEAFESFLQRFAA
jgi:hypothetical protein